MNYIKQLQKKTEELRDKRDRLKELCKPSSSNGGDVVTVRSCWGGLIEVVINTALEEGIPLSTVLPLLIREGLCIVSCNSTKVKDRLFHTVESEVADDRDVTIIDTFIIYSWTNSIYCRTVASLTPVFMI